MSDITNEQAVAALLATGIKSINQPDFFSLPPDQKKVALEEDLLEAQSRGLTVGDVTVDVLGVALKLISGGSALESAIGLVTGVPALVEAAKKL